ncbi:hypothetical protein NQ318_019857 [Aromia moschata]|uniref:Uncharacterized protein n=1 Tax=Aromia moschata TaxID=1265417 RepID=A0AAV8YKN5_9CUCU|nr:hypothetical protein NQ318_019857 [Aromia moschata]
MGLRFAHRFSDNVVCGFSGGLKAVVWTDTVQTIIMVGALVIVLFMGTASVGGFEEVWERNVKGGRIEFFNFDWDLTIRHSFWTVTIGNFFSLDGIVFHKPGHGAEVSGHAVPPTVAILVFGIMGLVSMCCYLGLIIYASYYKSRAACPDCPGLFVSGVFSAALSSMSTGLNSMTGVIFEDLIKPTIRKPLTEGQASFLMKVIVVIIGSICVGLVFVVEKMGAALIQASGSLGAITAGPLLGIFSLGMFFPQANPEGALAGGLASGALITWISIGTQMKMAQGLVRFPQKPASVEGCNANWVAEYLSLTLSPDATPKPAEPPFALYRLSYMYYTALGTVTALAVGLLVSYATGANKSTKVNEDLLSPVVYRFLDRRKSEINENEIDAKIELSTVK